MDSTELLNRTKKFALDYIKFFQRLPKTDETIIIGKQLLRSSTSALQITELLAEPGQGRSFMRKYALSLRNLMNHYSGWSFSKNPELEMERERKKSSVKLKNWFIFFHQRGNLPKKILNN
jgi:CubicO group peptidase (beta-lactamase class C family)